MKEDSGVASVRAREKEIGEDGWQTLRGWRERVKWMPGG